MKQLEAVDAGISYWPNLENNSADDYYRIGQTVTDMVWDYLIEAKKQGKALKISIAIVEPKDALSP